MAKLCNGGDLIGDGEALEINNRRRSDWRRRRIVNKDEDKSRTNICNR
ncbi:hypothetical protein AALP_AA6G302200 [Arabis alpina]|uniref:Uncharacterized protein n=1 Tax=Arabis alpina TaxID=50452 RepID=A0A087GSP5_ARAAL|nr:hypothetical protein AALP_AA6G302200 [Arabis alpina]